MFDSEYKRHGDCFGAAAANHLWISGVDDFAKLGKHNATPICK